jgi:hypothetical protein
MFLLYHSEGCNICGGLFCKCYINDLHTTTCSGMLGHRTRASPLPTGGNWFLVVFSSADGLGRAGFAVNVNESARSTPPWTSFLVLFYSMLYTFIVFITNVFGFCSKSIFEMLHYFYIDLVRHEHFFQNITNMY